MSFPLVDYGSDENSDDQHYIEEDKSIIPANTSTKQNFFSALDADSSSGYVLNIN